jgi:uncharacterized protein (DUF1697 family)
MPELKSMFEATGLTHVETFLASGNVLFETDPATSDKLHEVIEGRFQSVFGFQSQVFIRSCSSLEAIAALNPFPAEFAENAPTNCVGFTRCAPPEDALQRLKSLASDADEFFVDGSEIYWLSADRQSEASFTLKQLEKALGVYATFRGRNTIVRLAQKLESKG